MADSKKNSRFQRRAVSEEENFTHLQPQAPELERAVLGALMIDGDAYSMISETLKVESFYERRNQLVFEAVQALVMHEKPVDMLTVTNKLKELGTLEDVGGPYYVAKLCEDVNSSAHLEYHALIIAQKYLARQLISYTSRIQTDAFDEMKDVTELMQEAEAGLFAISQSNLRKDYTQIDPVIRDAYKMLHDASKRKDGLSGIASLFKDLDKITSGWQNSDLIIIAARPAMGKTAFANNIWNNVKNFATGISLIFDTTDIDIDEVYNLCKLVNGDIDLIIIDFLDVAELRLSELEEELHKKMISDEINNQNLNISQLKKRIKYCRNPLEKQSLQRELNTLYKKRKRGA